MFQGGSDCVERAVLQIKMLIKVKSRIGMLETNKMSSCNMSFNGSIKAVIFKTPHKLKFKFSMIYHQMFRILQIIVIECVWRPFSHTIPYIYSFVCISIVEYLSMFENFTDHFCSFCGVLRITGAIRPRGHGCLVHYVLQCRIYSLQALTFL